MAGTSVTPIQNPLTAFLPIKAGAVAFLREQLEKTPINGAGLDAVGTVHFARIFVFQENNPAGIPSNIAAVITTYDGDFAAYIQEFVDEPGVADFFRADAYGPPYTGIDDGKQRGLAGHFMCVDLSDQFEFLMSQWVNGANFAGGRALSGIDPLLGNVGSIPKVANETEFTYWQNGKAVTVTNLSLFVTTKGGLYCFIPSITALKWMAQNGGSSNPWTIPTAP